MEIHKRFVLKAHSWVCLIRNSRSAEASGRGIILVADSTFLITCGSTKGERITKDAGDSRTSVAFHPGRGITLTNIPWATRPTASKPSTAFPMATIITAASVSDQNAILLLLDELTGRYPDLLFALHHSGQGV